MDTIRNQKIGLRVAGTKTRQGGFAPLVAVGILAGDEGDNLDKITVIAEKPVYVIKHTDDYILYQLKDRKVKPCDRDTVGILSIALTIARDVQLADGKSPFTLLKEVYDKFVGSYMERRSDGLDSFIDKDIDQSEFVSIMEKYPLESRSSTYIPMNPAGMSGTLCVPQDKLAELFRDSQYQEFASFKEIEIGVSCMTMPGLENIKIPRPQTYTIIVNGKDAHHVMTDATDTFNTATCLRDTQDIAYDHISFSLSDLFTSTDNRMVQGKSSVELDFAHNRILCNVYGNSNMYALEIRCDGGTGSDRQSIAKKIQMGAIKLLIGGKVISDKREILASLTTQPVDITPNYIQNIYLAVASTVDNVNRKFIVTVSSTQRATSGTGIAQNRNNSNRKTANTPISPKINEGNNIPMNTGSVSDIDASYNNKPKKKRRYKKLIYLLVGLVLGMCIGFGSWGIHTATIGETKPIEDSLKHVIDSLSEQVHQLKAQEEAAKKAQEEAAKKAQEEAAAAKEATKAEILKLVNNKDLSACRNHPGWHTQLTKKECLAVEAVLNMDQYNDVVLKKKIEKELKGKTFNSWTELLYMRNRIISIHKGK